MATESLILSVFAAGCASTLDAQAEFRMKLHTIKKLFVQRDYLRIFTDASLLAAYVADYSPSRALAYRAMLAASPSLSAALLSPSASSINIYAIGAGSGAELVAITTFVAENRPPIQPSNHSANNSNINITLHCQDIADYSSAIAPIRAALAAKFNPSIFFESSVFDILSTETVHIAEKTARISAADFITAFFLLNELLANSKRDFVTFVKLLVAEMKPGALLVVVDSAGSFSEVEITTQSSSPSPSLSSSLASSKIKSTDSHDNHYKKKRASSSSPVPQQQQYSSSPTYMVYQLLDAIQ
ncbi:hypothetical protein HK100_002339, partial [Physocladia obscura]